MSLGTDFDIFKDLVSLGSLFLLHTYGSTASPQESTPVTKDNYYLHHGLEYP